MKLLASSTAIVLALTLAACSQETASIAPNAPVAGKADNFQLTDHKGRAWELYTRKDASAVVLVTGAVGDEATARLVPVLQKLQAAYEPKGAVFALVNSKAGDTRDAMKAEAEKAGLKLAVLWDDNQFVGEQLGVTQTAEVFVLDPKSWNVVYHGPVNRKLAGKGAAKQGSGDYVGDVLAAMTSGAAVPEIVAPLKGTALQFAERDRKAEHVNISYVKDIVPILEAKCVACHQEGGIGPFKMDSYEAVKGFSPMIREAVRNDRMPPWFADPHVGEFKDDKSLTAEESRTLVHWIEAGAPRGEGEDVLKLANHVAPEWEYGKPDLIIKSPAYKIPASGVVDYQRPWMPNPLKEGRWLKGSTVKVQQRAGVHHAIATHIAEIPKGPQASESRSTAQVAGYGVGAESIMMQKSHGIWVQPGGAIAFQMHYTPYGKEVTDTTEIGIYFYGKDEKPELMLREAGITDANIEIPPNDADHLETAYIDFPKEALLYSAYPHAHYRGSWSDMWIRYPDGKEKLLLNLPKYDFGWQHHYEFKEPVSIPAGSKLIVHYIYDNSKRNHWNPDPSQTIVWGEQSFEEMMLTKVRYRWMDETTANQQPENDREMGKTRMIGMMDDNIDGKVQEAELRGRLKTTVGARFVEVDANKDGGLDAAEIASLSKPQQQAAATPASGSR